MRKPRGKEPLIVERKRSASLITRSDWVLSLGKAQQPDAHDHEPRND